MPNFQARFSAVCPIVSPTIESVSPFMMPMTGENAATGLSLAKAAIFSPSDLACINFDRSGTTCIGKFIINHSFIIPGAIGITVGTLVSYALVMTFL